MNLRKLTLRREVLAEIDRADLEDVVGGDPTQGQTRFSCLTYISCYPQHCVNTRNCPEPI